MDAAYRTVGRTVTSMRLIDADALYKAMQDAEELARRRVLDTESTLPYPTNLNPAYTRYLAQMDERTKAKEMVADAPTVDAVPVRHGRWKSRFEGRLHYCSKCGWALMYTQGGEPPYMGDGYNRDNEERWLCRPGWCEDAMRYCPQCGAKMDGKDGGGNG